MATVTYVDARPMLWTAGRSGSGWFGWTDRPSFGYMPAWCRVRAYIIDPELMAQVPCASAPTIEVRVSHHGVVGMPL